MSMSDVIELPYCGNYNEPLDDAHEQDVAYETQCVVCQKYYLYYISYYPSYSAHKVPYANGEAHEYKPVIGLPKEYYDDLLRCKHCGDEKRASMLDSKENL
jgi:hypothetical protein